MKLFHLTIGLAVVLATSGFSGCTTFKTEAQQVEASCVTRNTALNALTVANNNHLLTDAQKAEVTTLKEQTSGPCTADSPNWDNVTHTAFNAGVARLETLRTTVEH